MGILPIDRFVKSTRWHLVVTATVRRGAEWKGAVLSLREESTDVLIGISQRRQCGGSVALTRQDIRRSSVLRQLTGPEWGLAKQSNNDHENVTTSSGYMELLMAKRYALYDIIAQRWETQNIAEMWGSNGVRFSSFIPFRMNIPKAGKYFRVSLGTLKLAWKLLCLEIRTPGNDQLKFQGCSGHPPPFQPPTGSSICDPHICL